MGIRVLTQNMYNGRGRPDSLREALAVHKPDVVAVQELAPNAAEVLQQWGQAVMLDPSEDTMGMGIAIRGEARLQRLQFPYRRPVSAVLSGDDWGLATDLQIVNTHLVNPISRPILTSKELRRRELEALRGLINENHGSPAQLLVGDFNSSPLWPLYRRLREMVTDGAVAAGTDRRTWGPWPSSPRLLRIDHAFTRGAVAVTGTRLVNVAGADHRGLLVEIEPA